jgi:ubiquinone/menaquinone biosynthesis C-methylase UbiE
MASRYDDELWELVPEDRVPPAGLCAWLASLEPAQRALDLGCGDGAVSVVIATETLTLADVSAVALERARARLPGADAVELEPDAPLPFADGTFDLVVCTETLEHVRDVQMFLSEIRRVLAPGGRVAITTPAHRSVIAAPDPFSPHLRFLTKRTLRALLDRMGFDVRLLTRRRGGLFALAAR